jgi:hypothetical protein
MNRFFRRQSLAVGIISGLLQTSVHAASSQWVYPDSNGRLVYKTFKAGDRIMDFSYAGYMGGGVGIPTVPVKKTVLPSGGDDTAAIQNAIDEVSGWTCKTVFAERCCWSREFLIAARR